MSIEAVTAAVGEESIDFAGMSSPDGAVTLVVVETGEAAAEAAAELDALVELHGGQVVKREGAACMCSFPSAHAGLRCALELGRDLGRLAPRVGAHSGFVLADGTDFYGRNVVLVGRIADHAEPGEVLVSAPLREYTGSDPTFAFEPRGEHYFKGLHGEHAVFSAKTA